MRRSTQKRIMWLTSLAKNRHIRLSGSTESAEQEAEAIALQVIALLKPFPVHVWVNVLSPSLETAFEVFADQVDAEKMRN